MFFGLVFKGAGSSLGADFSSIGGAAGAAFSSTCGTDFSFINGTTGAVFSSIGGILFSIGAAKGLPQPMQKAAYFSFFCPQCLQNMPRSIGSCLSNAMISRPFSRGLRVIRRLSDYY